MFHDETHTGANRIPEDMTADMGSAERVLHIPELLELICMHLPALDVLVNQRVSKTWQSTIQHSRCLQEKLFFKASVPRENNDEARLLEPRDFAWNPFILRFGTLGNRSVLLDTKTLHLEDYGHGSWKKMFVVNPTDYDISMMRGRWSWKPIRTHVEDPDGVRMSQIVDLEITTAKVHGLTYSIELEPMYMKATKYPWWENIR